MCNKKFPCSYKRNRGKLLYITYEIERLITHHLNHLHHQQNHQAYCPLMLESTGVRPSRLLARSHSRLDKNNS